MLQAASDRAPRCSFRTLTPPPPSAFSPQFLDAWRGQRERFQTTFARLAENEALWEAQKAEFAQLRTEVMGLQCESFKSDVHTPEADDLVSSGRELTTVICRWRSAVGWRFPPPHRAGLFFAASATHDHSLVSPDLAFPLPLASARAR